MGVHGTGSETPRQVKTFSYAVSVVQKRLWERGETLADGIRQRDLYFRVSILGACNLDCPFCHNEGGPKKGKLDISFAARAIRVAHDIGFHRVQFTGGEPLMHPRVADFVAAAREILQDVGITTNGTYLPAKLDGLVSSGLSRIHISLQSEALRAGLDVDRWTIPQWLDPVLDLGRQGILKVRLNLPVPTSDLQLAQLFLKDLSKFGCDVNLFSILPQNQVDAVSNSAAALDEVAIVENARRSASQIQGRVLVRGYRPPTGIRCATCRDKAFCKEQSHSLRLGTDRILRPCLATRKWDIIASDDNLRAEIEAAAFLALDYVWPEQGTMAVHV